MAWRRYNNENRKIWFLIFNIVKNYRTKTLFSKVVEFGISSYFCSSSKPLIYQPYLYFWRFQNLSSSK